MSGDRALRVAVVGTGFRARAFLALADRLPGVFTVSGVVTRSARSGGPGRGRLGVPTHRAARDLVRGDRPDLVVTALPPDVNPDVVCELVDLGLPVLSETPPAADVDGLRRLWQQVGRTGLVQVAEQYPLTPTTAARLRLLHSGVIGRVTSAQVSSTHLHHAAALVRTFLGTGFETAAVRAVATPAQLVDPLSRSGWTDDDSERAVSTTIATLGFAGGASALYDYTDNQMRNPLRAARTVVRGTRGELVDDWVTRLTGPRSVVRSPVVRRQTGQDLDLAVPELDLISCEGDVLYRNPFPGARLSDEEIAMATVLERAGAAARGAGEVGYPLAQGSQDALLGFAIRQSAATGRTVQTEQEAWCEA